MKKNYQKYFWLFLFIPQLISAQFYFFGRNKVQYENFNWKVIHTEHFNIYYYDDLDEVAKIGANFAEEAYQDLKVKFNHIVTNKIPLIFYNSHTHFQQTNTTPGFIPEGVGGFFEFMKGRVVIPYLGSMSEFQHVIKHELVHVFMTNKIYNQLYDRRLSTDRFPPLWFVEGLAEYWSADWDTQSEMVMRDAVLNGLFANLRNIESIYGSYLMYKEGQMFLKFVAKNYSENKILELLENFWRFKKFEDVIEFTLNEKFETIDEKWEYEIKKIFFPLYNFSYPHLLKSKKLTNYGFNFSPKVYVKNDKTEIYFIGNHNGYTSLMKLEYDSLKNDFQNPVVLIEGERDETFEAFHLLENSIDVSKNGLIAFVTFSQGKDVIHLFSINESKIEESLEFNFLIRIKNPSFSNDGNKIVFSATDKKGFNDLFIYNLTDKSLTRLTNDYYEDITPIFNKENTKIIFSSDRTSGKYKKKKNLFEIDLTTSELKYLTYVNANIINPKLSIDGKKLFFNCDFNGVYDIWQMTNDDSSKGMTQISSFITSIYDFDFLTDDKLITSAFEKFSFQFYELSLNNFNEKNYVQFEFKNIDESWEENLIAVNPQKDIIKYQKEYTLDYAVSQFIADPVYGNQGGAFLTLSDMLGDDRYVFYIYNTAEVQSEILKNFNVAISRINLKDRTNYGFGVFHFAGRRYDIRESNEYFYERIFGGYISLYFPFSSFQRIEAELSVANSDKELLGKFLSRKALLVSNTLSFVHDNSIWHSTGPIDGSRFRILLGYTSDVRFSNVNYYTLMFDYRKYFRLGLRSTFATRTSFYINDGKEARRFIAGGSWDLRGYPRFSIRGNKLWIFSGELRFPLIDRVSVNFPFFGLSFFNIRGATFLDLGSAWDKNYNQTLGSVGFGIRLNLFNVIALRYDIGKKLQNNLSNFQKGLFYQFFFGWDF
ncbi:MAG: hypothetical protein N2321_08840 [Melioribacteraceae bacterium]|nr:hypothetical protein [Melioribacteraceae bacterium]